MQSDKLPVRDYRYERECYSVEMALAIPHENERGF
jgi:hypothetical protein